MSYTRKSNAAAAPKGKGQAQAQEFTYSYENISLEDVLNRIGEAVMDKGETVHINVVETTKGPSLRINVGDWSVSKLMKKKEDGSAYGTLTKEDEFTNFARVTRTPAK
jgi:hypothetical protein